MYKAYDIPKGYKIVSFADSNFDVDKYYDAIWRGFDNKRERSEVEKESMKMVVSFMLHTMIKVYEY